MSDIIINTITLICSSEESYQENLNVVKKLFPLRSIVFDLFFPKCIYVYIEPSKIGREKLIVNETKISELEHFIETKNYSTLIYIRTRINDTTDEIKTTSNLT